MTIQASLWQTTSSRTSKGDWGSTVRDPWVQSTCTTTRRKDTQQAATMRGSEDHGSTVRDPRVQPTCTTTKRKSAQRATTMRGSDDQGSTEKDPWVQTACTASKRRNVSQTTPENEPEPEGLPSAYVVCAAQGVMIAPKSVALVRAKAQGLRHRPGALIPGSKTLQ